MQKLETFSIGVKLPYSLVHQSLKNACPATHLRCKAVPAIYPIGRHLDTGPRFLYSLDATTAPGNYDQHGFIPNGKPHSQGRLHLLIA